MSICETSKEDDFFLFDDIEVESLQTNEEQQKILKNVISEFRKNKENNQIKKLCSSYSIKKLPNNNKIYSRNNNDGTTTETKIEKEPNGREKIIQTRYDKDHKVISRKVYYNLNQNINNNNNNQNNINYDNNNRGHIFKALNGFTIETKIETLPNGRKKEIKIIRDENDVIVDTQIDELFDNNNMNNLMRNNMYNMNNNHFNHPFPMNNMMNRDRNPQMNYMNPMNMNMPHMNMNHMFSMPPMMNNNRIPFMMPMPMMPMPMMPMPMMPMPMMPFPMINPNAIDPNILNSLPETEVNDASKLDSDNKECLICLDEFHDKEKIICLPCIHVFHNDCIKSWFNKHNYCPKCKYKLTYQNMNSHP